ncbi:hypothetical protein LTR10_010620 [Elasticomyces elasticus]|nr:hypothetical protein LTR10_010620 [Elasticomyces elasticus]KAK4968226.1 hypothetical protein LTR42_009509 [Elasticomyces elasticus]
MLPWQRRPAIQYVQREEHPSDTELRVTTVSEGWSFVSQERNDLSLSALVAETQADAVSPPGTSPFVNGGTLPNGHTVVNLAVTLQRIIDTRHAQSSTNTSERIDLAKEFYAGVRMVATQLSIGNHGAEQIQEHATTLPKYRPIATETATESPADSKPTVMTMYIIRAGDASIAKERLFEFDQEIGKNRVSPSQTIDLAPEDSSLPHAEQQRRHALESDLRSANEDADLWRSRCVEVGLNPDAMRTRRRSSTLSS